MEAHHQLKNENRLIISYLTLRRSIGYMGFCLPFVLCLSAKVIFDTGLQHSLSAYYHTGVRSLFVATLCVVGAFLLSYKGYTKRAEDGPPTTTLDKIRNVVTDNAAANIAGACAVGLALFPTAPDEITSQSVATVSKAHFVFTGVFFLALVYISSVMFTMTKPGRATQGRKVARNRIYRGCAAIMVLCLLLIVVIKAQDVDSFLGLGKPVFWLEAAAIMAFGTSWLVKGETVLKD